MADKLDYTIQIDDQQYDITAADSLHADLTNQVEKALVVKKSVRKDLADIKDNLSLSINTKNGTNNLRADISVPEGIKDIGVKSEAERKGTNSFAYKGDIESTLDIVPSSGGVFTGPIYAPDINAGDGFNVNKFQVTNYNSVDTIIRELKGFPVYEWKRTSEPQVEALTAVTLKESEDSPPTMLPFKVVIYKTGGFWNDVNLKKLKFTNCTTACNFLIINANESDTDEYGRTLLGTYTPGNGPYYCTYVELRVKEADNADTLGAKTGIGGLTQPIYLAEGDDGGVATACYERAGGTAVTLNGSKKFIDDEATTETLTVASFYAPSGGGTAPAAATETDAEVLADVLLSAGAGKAPTWGKQNSLSVKEAKNVTQKIGGKSLSSIFVYKDDDKNDKTPDVMTTQVKSAAAADNVTQKIGGKSLSSIFVYKDDDKNDKTPDVMTTQVKSAAHADSATNATNAEKADKIYTYTVGGSASSAKFAANHEGYILYGENDPPTGKGTQIEEMPNNDNLFNEGNIYIKIEPST